MASFLSRQHTFSLPGLSWSGPRFLVLVLLPLTLLSACEKPGHTTYQSTKNVFYGVAAVSPTDIWAVGNRSSQTNSFFQGQVLIEHWDGRQWHTVPSSINGTLSGIAAVSANDIWAVGSSSSIMLLTMHWDGIHWSQVPTPGLLHPKTVPTLSAVAVISSHDVWAVGYQEGLPLILHWDGQGWHAVSPASPSEFRDGSLAAVQAISSTDIWAVGWYLKARESGYYTLAEHWDGKRWQFVPTPEYAQDHRILGNATFSGLAALSSRNLWAIGETYLSSVYAPRTLVEHWTGSHWEIVDTPMPSGRDSSYPQQIFAVNAQDLWITGYRYSPTTNYPLLLHWDGQSWQMATPPSLQSAPGVFFAGTAVAASDLWVVGSSGGVFPPAPSLGTTVSQTLVEHWAGFQPKGEEDACRIRSLPSGSRG